jgi:hypothetical protein
MSTNMINALVRHKLGYDNHWHALQEPRDEYVTMPRNSPLRSSRRGVSARGITQNCDLMLKGTVPFDDVAMTLVALNKQQNTHVIVPGRNRILYFSVACFNCVSAFETGYL